MKRAKLILAAVAVCAIAGGVYASKAQRIAIQVYKPAPGGTSCSILTALRVSFVTEGGQATNLSTEITPSCATLTTAAL
jgi:hypothetical protein